MKKIIFSICILLSIISLSYASSIHDDIESLIRMHHLSNASIGISVQDVYSEKILYQSNSSDLFIPASNSKIFTAIAAFLSLPKNFQFTTSIFYQKSQYKNGNLNGDLYIEFTGDPSLSGRSLFNLITQIKQRGIEEINGNIVLIANHFSDNHIPHGWNKNDIPYCFAASSSSMNMNKNCFLIKLIHTHNNATEVERIHNTSNITINNTTRLINDNQSKCTFNINMTKNNTLNLSGCIPAKAEVYLNLAIANPPLKTKQTINDFLFEIGIHLHGNIIFGVLPSKSHLVEVATTFSDSLNPLVKYMLLKSDNLYAESFARTIGYIRMNKGSTEIGTKAIKDLINKSYQIDINDLNIEDGSGLSTFNTVTPSFMVSLLTQVYKSAIGTLLYNSLPCSGESGTLYNRMGGKLQGKTHAKTGTLSGVSTISGYLLTKHNNIISFSIMLNDLMRTQRTKARMLEDNIIEIFYENF